MRLEVPERKTLVFEMTMPIRWGDMDAMGHVNNTVYFRYFESVRLAWLHQVCGAIDAHGEGVLIANAFCNFMQQLEYPGDVIARLFVANPGALQLRHFRHTGANRLSRRGLRERRRDRGVGRLQAAEVAPHARLAARAVAELRSRGQSGAQRRARFNLIGGLA